jgi:hypothetical protein
MQSYSTANLSSRLECEPREKNERRANANAMAVLNERDSCRLQQKLSFGTKKGKLSEEGNLLPGLTTRRGCPPRVPPGRREQTIPNAHCTMQCNAEMLCTMHATSCTILSLSVVVLL